MNLYQTIHASLNHFWKNHGKKIIKEYVLPYVVAQSIVIGGGIAFFHLFSAWEHHQKNLSLPQHESVLKVKNVPSRELMPASLDSLVEETLTLVVARGQQTSRDTMHHYSLKEVRNDKQYGEVLFELDYYDVKPFGKSVTDSLRLKLDFLSSSYEFLDSGVNGLRSFDHDKASVVWLGGLTSGYCVIEDFSTYQGKSSNLKAAADSYRRLLHFFVRKEMPKQPPYY